jgi:hypothetical protein
MKKSPLSIADGLADVFIEGGIVYRLIKEENNEFIRQLFEVGLIERLSREGVIPRTTISERKFDGVSTVVEQERIVPVIYPFEWSPEMLRSAALCTLRVNKIANIYGYELKDAQPFNIVFQFGSPLHVDLGSFVKRVSINGWRAESEFVDCYHRVLAIAELGLSTLFKHSFLLNGNSMRGEQAVLASKVLNIVGWKVARYLLLFVSIYKRSEYITYEKIKFHLKSERLSRIVLSITRFPYLPFKRFAYKVHEKRILGYRLSRKTSWSHYHQDSGFYENNEIRLNKRFNWVLERVNSLGVATVTEIAGNQGVLSRAISRLPNVERVICTDYDSQAIDELHRRTKSSSDKLFMACFDFMSDVREALTRERGDRLRSDMVIALAVTHHLVLAQSYTLEAVIDALKSFTQRYLIIEYMPLGLWNGVLAPSLPEWYSRQWFESALSTNFKIIECEVLEKNRIVYLAELI